MGTDWPLPNRTAALGGRAFNLPAGVVLLFNGHGASGLELDSELFGISEYLPPGRGWIRGDAGRGGSGMKASIVTTARLRFWLRRGKFHFCEIWSG